MLKGMNENEESYGLTDAEEERFRDYMKQIKSKGPEDVSKEILKQTMTLYNKSEMGEKPTGGRRRALK